MRPLVRALPRRQIHRDAANAVESSRGATPRNAVPRLQAVHINRPVEAAPNPAVLNKLETTRTAHAHSRAPPRLQAVHLHRPAEVKVEGGVETPRMRAAPAKPRLQAIHIREKEGDLRTLQRPPGAGDRPRSEGEPAPVVRRGLLSWLSRS
ncbi:hypothetical protein Q8F55_005471 [Vanrija albida]|uniref:Uncharacterized protein n=1 Tax=Vanrija albida TaxID=181172 RepID=A0ABR3Q1Y2_9TREE